MGSGIVDSEEWLVDSGERVSGVSALGGRAEGVV